MLPEVSCHGLFEELCQSLWPLEQIPEFPVSTSIARGGSNEIISKIATKEQRTLASTQTPTHIGSCTKEMERKWEGETSHIEFLISPTAWFSLAGLLGSGHKDPDLFSWLNSTCET